jgi:hypothetical protein
MSVDVTDIVLLAILWIGFLLNKLIDKKYGDD